MGTSTPPPASGRLIAGRYRLRRVLGNGAMGLVWLAYDEVLHRSVAVKEVRLPPGMPTAEADSVRERTLREARAIAALTHPNVIAVFDVARQDGEPFVVMELMASRSLAEVVGRQGRCTGDQAALIADAVAAALEAAHRRGITHRDVKPGNVLVGEDGQIKLTDFGIARNVSEVTMTSSGMILGTPAFIAPEVAAGDPVTPSADLWGLGATLFAVVTGRPPYNAGDDPVATVTEVVHGEVPQPDPELPLADVISALMVKDPAARIGLVEVRRRIRPLLPEPGTRAFPVPETEQPPGDETPTKGNRQPVPPRDAGVGAEPVSSEPAALADDPGPLPFVQPGPVSATLAPEPGPLPFRPARPARRRGAAASAALAALGVVVFVLAAGGGFAAVRTLDHRSLLPPPAAQTTTTITRPAPQPAPDSTLVARDGDAYTLQGAPGGTFTVSVPTSWAQFLEQRASKPLPPSCAVRYVSLDGSEELTVERFPDLYPSMSIDDYLAALRQTWPDVKLLQGAEQAPPPGGNDVEKAKEVTYRTVDPGDDGSSSAHRTTYAALYPRDNDLWVVSLTVPTQNEGPKSSALFEGMRKSFTVNG